MAEMTLDDYRKEVKQDIRCWIDDNDAWPKNKPESDEWYAERENIENHVWIADSVTGNASGSYTMSTYKAAENVSQLIWDEDLWDLLKEIGTEAREAMEKGPEFIDISIRCALVSDCLEAVLEAGPDGDESED